MGQVARALAVGPEIEFEGQVYRVAPITYELQGLFESFLERRAVEAIRRQRSYLTDDEYAAKMDQVDRNIAAGVYSFGGQVCVEAAESVHGIKELLRICLRKNHPEVDGNFVDRLFDAKTEEVAKSLKQANPDPLVDRPPGAPGAG